MARRCVIVRLRGMVGSWICQTAEFVVSEKRLLGRTERSCLSAAEARTMPVCFVFHYTRMADKMIGRAITEEPFPGWCRDAVRCASRLAKRPPLPTAKCRGGLPASG